MEPPQLPTPDGARHGAGGPGAGGAPPLAAGAPAMEPSAPFGVTIVDRGPRRRRPRRRSPFRRWLDRAATRTRPFAISLVLNVVVIAVLALVFVAPRRPGRFRLDLSFASPAVTDAVTPGVPVALPPDRTPDPAPVAEPPTESVGEPAASSHAEDPPDTEGPPPPVGQLLSGRDDANRAALVAAAGGSDETEAAVARALEWLARHQSKQSGLWSLKGPYLDPGPQENQLAATAMALLAFQGAGTTPDAGRHRAVVERAWRALVKKQLDDGRFDLGTPIPPQHEMYAHAQITIAACELYGMTHDPRHREVAQRALSFAIDAQGPNGGWRYAPGQEGDMSVTGWYVMALTSGRMAGLDVPAGSFEGLARFLDGVAVNGGARYGYRRLRKDEAPKDDTEAISAEGLLARLYLGWRPAHPQMATGLQSLVATNGAMLTAWNDPEMRRRADFMKDVYAWYYITQVAHHCGGEPWQHWNRAMRTVLPAQQVQGRSEAGSWDPASDRWGYLGGRLFMTSLCASMLEVYYRHLPLYGDAAVKMAARP